MPTPSSKATETSGHLNEGITRDSTEQGDVEEDDMVDMLEECILEAYNNMQIDEEYIFLPHDVAEKLHHVTELMTSQVSTKERTETKTNAGEDSGSEKDAVNETETEELEDPEQEIAMEMDQHEQEEENEQIQEKGQDIATDTVTDQQHLEDDETGVHELRTLQAKKTETCVEQKKEPVFRVATETISSELASVLDVDQSASSGPPSPPHSRSKSKANTPKPRKDAPVSRRGQILPPQLVSTRSSLARSLKQTAKSPTPRTPDQSGGNKRKSKLIPWDKKINVTPKPKEDKKQRELLARETARKQRENSKRQLEEIHQREMEEKRERVRRIKEERLQRRSGMSTEAKRAKKTG
ncbi:hypothetical protein PsorP6_004358 [Peronosclerospora sorghi]|uniref:Uncharacterized protein n=1 Tax=Peronosclerospora sorghi TaxID=230839 RepID=A0ACC0VKR2_9STRA|nr:hypothetical protein PsorP6_004358 [Peronosclerospora sorghi]